MLYPTLSLIFNFNIFPKKKALIFFCLQELYHEFHALDRFEQDYERKYQEEDNLSSTQRGDEMLAILII